MVNLLTVTTWQIWLGEGSGQSQSRDTQKSHAPLRGVCALLRGTVDDIYIILLHNLILCHFNKHLYFSGIKLFPCILVLSLLPQFGLRARRKGMRHALHLGEEQFLLPGSRQLVWEALQEGEPLYKGPLISHAIISESGIW